MKVDRRVLEASRPAHRAVLESKWELRNVQTRTADSPRGSSPLAPSTVSPKYLPPPLGVRPPSPMPHPCRSCVSLSKHMPTHILTRVPVSALSVYEELENLRLVLGSSGISSLFLNHWYWDLGKPSSSTQLSSADFPKGTDFGTLHFGTTGFTVATQNIWSGSSWGASHLRLGFVFCKHHSGWQTDTFYPDAAGFIVDFDAVKKQQCNSGSQDWRDGYTIFGPCQKTPPKHAALAFFSTEQMQFQSFPHIA